MHADLLPVEASIGRVGDDMRPDMGKPALCEGVS